MIQQAKIFFCLRLAFSAVLLLSFNTIHAQKSSTQDFTKIDPKDFGDNAGHWYGIFNKENIINALPGRPKYQPTQINEIADNILLFQKSNGGWPKNYDVFAILSPAQKDSVLAAKRVLNTTYDNGTTYTHIAALCIAYKATAADKYKLAAAKGLEYILKSQYKNGGWPQYYPLESNYSSHITFNDGVFNGIMQLLKDIKDAKPQYVFIEPTLLKKLNTAYEKGLDCIVKTQIKEDGKLTAWCQQHDEVTLLPAWARKFEPAAICNKESADLVLFLMSIDHPSKEIINAIENAVAWFEDSKIYHTRVNTVAAAIMPTKFRISEADRVVVEDTTAPPIWTRFYELKTHRPLFCNRDSKVVYSLAEVERERRDGYAWYSYAPQQVLNKYPNWQKKWVIKKTF